MKIYIGQIMIYLYFALVLKISFTRATVFPYKFRSFFAPCAMTHSIYYNVSSVSDVRCGSLCNSNAFGTCGRFVWDPKERTCFLHSTRVNVLTFSISPEDTWMTYSKFLQECNDAGYDFDSETNTCLKYHEVVPGVTWKQSRVRCQQDGGDLISIQTKAKWDFITNYVRKCAPKFWVGLKNKKWNTGEDFKNVFGVDVLLNYFDSGFTSDPEVDCGALGDWVSPIQDESCNMRLRTRFLCEIVVP